MKGVSKDWYVSNQIKSYDEGPYRFHIQKRIAFLKQFLTTFVKKNGQFQNILDLGCGKIPFFLESSYFGVTILVGASLEFGTVSFPPFGRGSS